MRKLIEFFFPKPANFEEIPAESQSLFIAHCLQSAGCLPSGLDVLQPRDITAIRCENAKAMSKIAEWAQRELGVIELRSGIYNRTDALHKCILVATLNACSDHPSPTTVAELCALSARYERRERRRQQDFARKLIQRG